MSTNVVEVLGETSAASLLGRPRTAPAKDGVNTQHLHEQVPVLLPVPQTDDLVGKTVRVTEPLPQRFYEPGSHISPHVRWKLSQLKKASSNQNVQPIAMKHVAVQPDRLNVIEAVFAPVEREIVRLDDPLDDFWEYEQFYIEAIPTSPPPLGGSAPIPEPGTGLLVSLGLFGIAARRRSRLQR